MKTKPVASLSLDLDNEWSYLKTHGDASWSTLPTYLDLVVPRFLDVVRALDLEITVFVVGQDAALDKNASAFKVLGATSHEIGNHSFHHEPWLHTYAPRDAEREIAEAEDAIVQATGKRPRGFRGPGYSVSPAVLDTLVRRDYTYDCSTLPTYIGPLARAYYFMTAKLTPEERERRKALFGGVSDGLRPLRPYCWHLPANRSILEIPVTTFPVLKIPFHLSYILYLASYSRGLALAYFKAAVSACRAARIGPSLLLHPLDFLGADDVASLAFFPSMDRGGAWKTELVRDALAIYAEAFDVVPVGEHARRLLGGARLSAKPVSKLLRGASSSPASSEDAGVA